MEEQRGSDLLEVTQLGRGRADSEPRQGPWCPDPRPSMLVLPQALVPPAAAHSPSCSPGRGETVTFLQPSPHPQSPRPSLLPAPSFSSSHLPASGLREKPSPHVRSEPSQLATSSAHLRPLSGHLPVSCGTAFQGEQLCPLTPRAYPALLGLSVPPGAPRPCPSLAVASPRSPRRRCCSLVLEEQTQVMSLPCSASPRVFLLSHGNHGHHSGP